MKWWLTLKSSHLWGLFLTSILYKLKSTGISGEFYNLLEKHLSGRFQWLVLNGRTSSWRPVLAAMLKGSILGPLFFLVYIKELPNDLNSNVKLFDDDTSLFTIVKDKNECANIINNDLLQISKWAYNWKMLFYPDPNKLVQEVLFSRKNKLQVHLTIYFNNMQVEEFSIKNTKVSYLMKNLTFKKHIDSVISYNM